MTSPDRGLSVVLLDCDGVIRHWDQQQFAELARTAAGCEPEQLAAIAFHDELLTAAMTGAVTAEVWADSIGQRAGEAHGAEPAVVAEGFLALGWRIDSGVIEVVRRVRAEGRRVAILSNASTRLETDLEAAGVTAEVDAVLSSARLGVAKPDPAIYQQAAQRLGVKPTECLFVDDQSRNVVGARGAGMTAEVFMGAPALATLLVEVGLLSR